MPVFIIDLLEMIEIEQRKRDLSRARGGILFYRLELLNQSATVENAGEMIGSLTLLAGGLTLYIVANLAVGYTFSTMAQNQLQAMQMTLFFILPTVMLSGFAFPFMGMPAWARWLGEILPATHFLRIVRGILLKGNGAAEIWPELWPLVLFTLAAGAVAVLRFRRTLD